MTRLRLIPGAFLITLACGGSPGANSPAGEAGSANSSEFDAEAALARESSGLGEHSYAKPPLSFKVPASAEPQVRPEDKVTVIAIPIGEGGEVSCFLYEDDLDPGAVLLSMLNNLKKSAKIRQITPREVQVVREAPVASVSALYTVEEKGENLLGQLKLAYHTRLNHSTLCLGDQVGYSKTFHDVSTALFETLENGREDLNPRYVEISAASVQDVPAGFERSMIFGDAKEERRVTVSLLMLLRSPSDLVTSDSVSTEVANADQRVVAGRWFDSESGKPNLEMSLELGAGGTYRYQGTFRGKPIEGSFSHSDKRGLPSARALETELKRRIRKPGAFTLSHVSYHPGQDPTRPAEETYSRLADDPQNRVRFKQGELEVVGTVDAQGRLESGDASLGRMKFRLARVFVRGTP